MAFVKRTWFARLGTGLNKFLIGDKDSEGKQTLVNAPDSVDQQGDVISAENLNDLEARIESGFNEKIDLANTFNERTWNKPGYLFDWDMQRGNLNINSLNAFEDKERIYRFDNSSQQSIVTNQNSNPYLSIFPLNTVVRFHCALRNESGNDTTSYRLRITVAPTGTYIGRWYCFSHSYQYRSDMRDNINLHPYLEPTYTPDVITSNFSDEALMHIIKENYGGYGGWGYDRFPNHSKITKSGTGAFKFVNTGTIDICDMSIHGWSDTDPDRTYGYSGIKVSLWLCRIA